VTISGGLVLGVGTTEYGGTKSGLQLARQTGNIAFKGVEDLGGGLSASFEVQQSIGAAADTRVAGVGATTLGDRGAYLAVSGGFGTVLVGRAASAIRANFGAVGDVSRLAIPHGLSEGSASHSAKGTLLAAASGDAAARAIYGDAYSNMVAYQSPTISGFNVAVGIAPNEGDTATTKDTLSYGLNYAEGPLAARFNITDVKAISTDTAYKWTTLNASYDFGVAKVGATYQTTSVASGVKPGAGIAFTANIPMGAGSIGLGYGRKAASEATNLRAGGDDMKHMFVGYRHDLSKRTNVQAIYNKADRVGTTTDTTETFLIVGHSF